MNNQVEGKRSEFLVAPKMQRKTLKREVRRTTSVKGRHISKKKSKKHSKGSAKRRRTFISYEYEMKSCLTWEFADVFQNINYWHESVKGENSEEQPLEIEQQMNDVKTVDEILVRQSRVENTNLADDQQNRNAGGVDKEAVAMGANTTTFNGTVTTHSTAARHSVNTPIDGEETFEETTKNPRRTPRYLKRQSMNNEIIRKPAACDNLGIGTLEDDMKLPGMLEQQELRNAAANSSGNGVEIHTNDMQHMKNTAVQSTDPKGLNLTKKKQFKCSDCQKEFMRNEHLIVHRRIHSGEQSFKCTECPQVFSQKSHLTVHMRIHSGEKPYKCMQCPQVFSRKSNLIRHHRIHSGETPFKCTDCPQVFSQKGSLTTHLRIHSGEKPFKCGHCPKKFSDNNYLKSHLHTHSGEKPFKCTECSQVFARKSSLTIHQRIHSGEKPFKCTECPQTFAQSSDLTRHLRIHSGEKPFKCNDCPQAFSRKEHLTTHQRIHSEEKPFKCTECPQAFSQKQNLRTHKRIHSGEKPFKCTECPQAFTRNIDLTRHQCIHSGEKPFLCPHCLKTFTRSSRMKKHILTHQTE